MKYLLALFGWAWAVSALAQHQVGIVSQASHIRALADGTSATQCQVPVADTVVVLNPGESVNGYYLVKAKGGCQGYLYRNRVRLRQSGLPKWAIEKPAPVAKLLKVCSFNIKFLGHYTRKDNEALAKLLGPFDLVVVQELVASPVAITSSTKQVPADPESAAFVDEMRKLGFSYALGSDCTGQTEKGATSREWPIAFYRTDVISYNASKSNFIEPVVLANSTFDRVPWGFHFTTLDSTLDFVLVSVHLAAAEKDRAKRKAELARIAQWAEGWPNEFDHIVVGDMNLQDTNEVRLSLPNGYATINTLGLSTNCSTKSPKPFDQVFYRPAHTARDLDLSTGFGVINLIEAMHPFWNNPMAEYPGKPYDGTLFPQYYSDHHPVTFNLIYGVGDDD